MPTPVQKPLTPRQFAALNRPEQLAALRQASARQKLVLLLDAADGEELLALLPPQDVYLLARELGPDQIPELLGMASAEQWTALFDFDCWSGDVFDRVAAREWLAVLLQGEEPWIAATLLAMDFELLVLMLSQEVRVLSGPEELAEEEAIADGRRREQGYLLDYRDDDGAKLFGALLDILFRHAPEFCGYLLEAVRAEEGSLLEESVYRQRADRLLDQGLPEPHAARVVYAWLDPERFAVEAERKIPLGGSVTGTIPGAVMQLARPRGVLGTALAAGVNDGTAWELACLVNKVLMAERVDLGELAQVKETAARTFDTLNLGLEYLAGSDGAAANRSLHQTYVEQLFRLGFSLTLRLQRRARALREAAIGPFLDPSFRALLVPLLQPRPSFPEAAERPGAEGMRPFARLAEVELVEAWLARLEVQRRLFEEHFPFALPAPEQWELRGCHPGSGSDLTLSTIFLTALANRLLGRPLAPQPLAAGELGPLHALVTAGGKLAPEVQAQTLGWLESLEPGGSAFGEFCLARWEEEFCAVDSAALDPRFVGGLIVRAA